MSVSVTLDNIVSLAKRRGFIFPTSEIYGGLANTYDYGPLGAELLNHIKAAWWKYFITDREDMVGLDSAILQHPQTWVASGHVASFTDPLVEDKVTHKRYRADHLIETWAKANPGELTGSVEDLSTAEMSQLITEHNIKSPDGNDITPPKDFNILFESSIGVVSGEKSKVYLRGETAQGIFANFKQILDSTRVQLPFGVGQIGTSFRNEITTGQFIFRMLEFRQAEIEYFFDPDIQDWHKLFKSWQDAMWQFVTKSLGIDESALRWRQHTDQERSHYSKDTYDLDYHFPFGWKELWGIAYRTDYDLKQHAKHSGRPLEYTHPQTGKKIVPHVIEPAVGIDRLLLMMLCHAYREDDEHQRTFLALPPKLAPYQVAIFPLLKNKPELVTRAREIYTLLKPHFRVVWDERGNIGKRYYAQDEIGTPFCITIDFDTLKDNSATLRHRDTTQQDRVHLTKLIESLSQHLSAPMTS